jgi:hypothetical protein
MYVRGTIWNLRPIDLTGAAIVNEWPLAIPLVG